MMRSWKAALSFSTLEFTLLRFNQWPPWSNTKFKTRPQQAFVPNEEMENNKYKRSKEILLQVFLAGEGARAGQGKVEEWRREEPGTRGFSHFTPSLYVMVEYIAEMPNGRLFLTSKLTVHSVS